MQVDRRKFLAGVAVASAAPAAAPRKTPVAAPLLDRGWSGSSPSAQMAAAETATPKELPLAHAADGSDFMVDVIKTLDFEYLPANPASSFRGLHESLIDYGGNRKPEFLTCMHEESAVAMAHGYFKAAGKPL
jgi:acetolactate synthase-1/2/3 large subunit